MTSNQKSKVEQKNDNLNCSLLEWIHCENDEERAALKELEKLKLSAEVDNNIENLMQILFSKKPTQKQKKKKYAQVVRKNLS